jgi:hypothetical protein
MSLVIKIFNIFLTFLLMLLLQHDFQFQILRQRVMCGTSRTELFLDGLLRVVFCCVLSVGVSLGLSLAFVDVSSAPLDQAWGGLAPFLVLQKNGLVLCGLMLSCFLHFMSMHLITLWVNKGRIIWAMCIIFIWHFLAEPIAVGVLEKQYQSDLGRYLPTQITNSLLGNLDAVLTDQASLVTLTISPSIWAVAVGYGVLFTAMTLGLYWWRDL